MINKLPSFDKLLEHSKQLKKQHLKDLFLDQTNRFDEFSIQDSHLFLDYSKNLITQETLDLLESLLNEADFETKRRSLFNGTQVNGEHLNSTENRQVLHTALRLPKEKLLSKDSDEQLPSEDIRKQIYECRKQIQNFVEQVHNQTIKGYTGKPIKTIVSIGIGGSFLGPKMASKALTPFAISGYSCHYIANIDSADFYEVINKICVEDTIFLLQSKSFGTIESIYNGEAVKQQLRNLGLNDSQISQHFYAVTANNDEAIKFGIPESHIFPMWDWVGGRYSLWSAIGIPIAFQIGWDNFESLLQGAYEMDQHFLTSDTKQNIPVILGILGVWYHNYFDANNHAVLPYSHYLRYLPHHLQQLDMESNGKQVTQCGLKVQSNTGPIVWGGEGTNGQHAFHQLLHQGTHLIPCDFLIAMESNNPIGNHHRLLVSNCFSQSKALMEGKTYDEALDELIQSGVEKADAQKLAPHKVYEGNRPSNTILFDKLSPEVLGALIAAYEHKVFVQGVLWGINSFDQWGVELGKQMGKDIFHLLDNKQTPKNFDSSSEGLIHKYRKTHLQN